MNKQELDQNLEFLFQQGVEIQIIIYALLRDQQAPVKINIDDEDLPPLKTMFINSIQELILTQPEYTILPLSTADERTNCFYEYDLDLPEELEIMKDIIGNDNIANFNFNDAALLNITSLIIVLGNGEHQVSLYKKVSPVELIGRGSLLFYKFDERFERFEKNLLRISSGFQALSINDTVIILNLKTIEKSFGFVDVIQREALLGIDAIRNMQIIQNIDDLAGLISNITFARKLIKIARSSPVILRNIPNASVIAFTATHPALIGKLKYNEDQTLINLDTKIAKDLFVKLLNDDFLTSELTQLYYDSLAKDGIIIDNEDAVIGDV